MAGPLIEPQGASNLLERYGPVLAGLVIGTAAKYGLTLNEGRKLTWRGVVADLLLLGLIGLLALGISDWFQLVGDQRVFVASMAAVSSDRLVRMVRRSFEKAVAQQADRLIDAASGGPGNTPAGEFGRQLTQLAEKHPDETMLELLKRLDRID